jgi:hypothetical protein
VIGVNEKYRNYLTGPTYQRGATFRYLPEHTWALGGSYASGATSVDVNFSGAGMLYRPTNELYYAISAVRLRTMVSRAVVPSLPSGGYPALGYVMTDVNVSRKISPVINAVAQIQNLTNRYRNDLSPHYASIGRQTKLGVRIRY